MPVDHLEIGTDLVAPPGTLWVHATSIAGIVYELGPWLRMTVPRGLDAEAFAASLAGPGTELPAALGRSWILLFGAVPFDWDNLVIAEVEPGRRFLERSTTLSMRVWQHERTIEPRGDGSRVVDRLRWEPRALVPRAVARRIVTAIFNHRHERLAERFG